MTRWIFRALLTFFPSRFRNAFGQDMLATFEDRWRDNRGFRTASRIFFDMLTAGILERLSTTTNATQLSNENRGDGRMAVLLQDLRYACRMLLRTPTFTFVALSTLALGIGINTAMFSVAHSALWSSLPYPDPSRLVAVGEVEAKDPNVVWGTSYLNFRDWQTRAASFDHLAVIGSDNRTLVSGAVPVSVSGLAVTHDFFGVMGVAPALGRAFGKAEDEKGKEPVIVLGHRMWKERFAGDPSILGRSVRFDGTAFTVIGVMPAGFEYRQSEYWVPLEQVISDYFRNRRNVWVFSAIGRLREGKTVADAQIEVQGITTQLHRDYPETDRGLALRVSFLKDEWSRDLQPGLLVLLGAVSLVLLIACGNVGGLMLVRGAARGREIAIRSALGVTRSRLVRQLLTESALLAAAGGIAGLSLSVWATRSIHLLTNDVRLIETPLDIPVLLFACIATAVTMILFGVLPAVYATRLDVSRTLASRGGGSLQRGWAQRILVVGQVSWCLVLLISAGLLLRSLQHVLDVHPGFRTENLITMRAGLPSTYRAIPSVIGVYERIQEKVAAMPGASGVTFVNRLPISGGEPNGDINLEGRPAVAGELGTATFRRVMPNYFNVMGIPLVLGRVFDERDRSPGNVIIDQSFRQHFWPNENPLGKRIKIGPIDSGVWLTIVGVVGDVRQLALDSDPPFSTYEPLLGQPSARFDIAVRSGGESQPRVETIQSTLRSIEPGVLIDRVATMSQRIDATVAPRKLNLALFGMFAVLALVLAGLGLYGVVAYAAEQRTQEFGIRVALGARSSDVLRLVIAQGLRLAIFGTCLGLVAAFGVSRFLRALLFGVEGTDPWTFVAASALLLGVALAASLVPAMRATRVPPTHALRGE